MYRYIRPLLFRLPTEVSHELSLDWLAAGHRLGLSRLAGPPPKAAVTAMGLKFSNPVGLAAGLDKNGDFIDALAALGFGFVEVGTVTPRPQSGNPQPRLFRLPEHQAIINRMGFNNKGCAHLVERLKKRRYGGVLGVNIGKNKDTPDAQALDDYNHCLTQVYPYADYITINISSPNTPGLRDLQFGEPLKRLLGGIKTRQRQLTGEHGRRVPLAVKLAPDLAEEDLRQVAATLVSTGMDAVIATNTTVSRAGVEDSDFATQAGGLSGAPLEAMANRALATLRAELPAEIPIIGVGGIRDGASAARKLAAGASLLQVYTGFIYQGPAVIRAAVDAYIHHRPL